MLEFLFGALFGAVVGVAADQLWTAWKAKPRFEMRHGVYQRIGNEEGMSYSVRNVSYAEIPDYQIGIFHPDRGIFFAFPSDQDGPLLPEQTRDHECVMVKNGKIASYLDQFFFRSKTPIQSEDDVADFSLQIVMKNSNLVLFESSEMGNGIARQWLRAGTVGNWKDSTWEESQAMNSPASMRIKHWLERRHDRKLTERLLNRHKAERKSKELEGAENET